MQQSDFHFLKHFAKAFSVCLFQMATGRDELASWNPMDEDYRDETFNSYDRGPGKNLPRNSQRRTGVNLYVTNIPNSVTSEGLKNLFGRCGLVKDARVCVSKFTTQYNTTFGFVVMENTSGGTEALRLMNGFKIGNVQLTVKIAKTDEEKQKEKEEREKMVKTVEQHTGNKVEVGKKVPPQQKSKDFSRSTQQKSPRAIGNQKSPQGISQKSPGAQSSQKSPQSISQKSPKPNQQNTGHVSQKKSPVGGTSQRSPAGATIGQKTPQKSPRMAAEQKLSIPSTNLPIGSEMDVIVLAVTSPGSIAVQVFDHEMVQAAVEQDAKMTEIYNQDHTQVSCPAVGDFLVGNYMGNWYRLQVNQVISKDKFQVTYVDYGNKETVSLAELRYLKPEMVNIPAQAIECCLECVGDVNSSNNWSPASISRVQELVPPTVTSSVLYKVKAIKADGGITHIKLIDGNGVDVGDKLLSEGLVGSVQTQPVPSLRSPTGGTSQRSPAGATGSQKTPQKSPRMAAEQKPSIPPTKLPMGNEVDVIVLAVTSPGSIVVQVFDHEMVQAAVDQDARMTEIYNQDHTQVSCPAVGDFLVGNYMGNWYRLQVNQVISPDKFQVTYVDYGNKETVSLAELRYLKPDMCMIPAQAIECCLDGISDPNWSPASIERVKELVPPTVTAGVLYKVKAVKDDGNITSIKLTDGNGDDVGNNVNFPFSGDDVGNKLLSEGRVGRSVQTQQVPSLKSPVGGASQRSPASATGGQRLSQGSVTTVAEQKSLIPSTILPIGSEVDVIVLAVTSPGSIVVQVFDHEMVQAAVDQDARMTEIYNQDHTQVSCPAVGDFMVGNYMGNWYRLQVNQVISTDKFQVTYVDYGNKETVSLAEMRYLKPDMLNIPAQAIECCLEGIGDPNWSPASIERVNELVPPTLTAGVLYKAKAVRMEGNLSCIKLLDGNGVDIGDTLLSEGLVSTAGKKSEVFMAKSLGNISDLMTEGGEFDLFVIDKKPPNRLVCQVLHRDYVEMFTQFQQAFLELMEKDTSTEYKPQCVGELVVGKFSGDQMWYRAEVLALTDNNATLCYVDFGNKEQVPFTSIRHAVEICTRLPIQSFVCVPINQCSLEQAVKISAVVKKKENSEVLIQIQDAMGLTSENTEETVPKVQDATPRKIMYSDIQKITLPVNGSKVAMTFSDASSLYSFHLRKCDSESQAELDKVMKDVHEYCTKNVDPYKPEVNEMVCVQFSADGAWYRGRVTNIEGDAYSVQYVDHGNSENVSIKAIRKIDPCLLVTPLQSVHCRVAGMMPELQTNDMVGVFATAMQSPIIHVQAKHVGADVTDVVIFLTDGTNLNEVMLGADNNEVKVSPAVSSKPAAVSPKPSAPPAVQDVNKTFTVPQLQVPLDGSRINVTVTDLLGLCSFAAQSLENMQEFAQMSSYMGEFCESLKEKHTPAIDEIVFAKFSADNQWYRAKVVECIATENFHLTFIDYGNSDIVQSSCIRKMTTEFTALPAQSFQCKLSGVMEEGQPEDALMTFAGKVLNNQLQLQAIKKKNDVYEVELFSSDGVSINNMFKVIAAPATASVPSPITNGVGSLGGTKLADIEKVQPKEQCSLLITHVNSPKDFYCQIADEDNIQLLGVLMNNLALECAVDTPNDNFKPVEGDLCCAKYEVDDGWYRSFIKAVLDDGQYRVHYLDFGNEGVVSGTGVHPPSEEFFKLPVMAFQCSLIGIDPSGSSWTPASVAKMNEFQMRELSAIIKSKEKDVLQVQVSWEGTDLADCLVQAGLARKATVGPAGDAAAMSEEEKEAIQRQIAQLQAMIGDFSIIQDRQLRGLLKKGPKYRIPSKIDFIKCREVLKEALDNYTKRWCKSEGVESHSLNDWKNLILDITDIRIDNFHKNPHLFENPSSRSERYFKSKLRNLHEKFVFAPADKAANNTIII
ncbi:hypothetical protein FSP39_025170 [Pinctada imbricata]|uniref:Uncharacterized protein n=1 Tax=Pinctada imbricata TaxID=66713 RepID=A0AA89C662_PINIB|nr:hypothetical protein FSP39_025170 [Pinctada imbricata]